MSSPTRAPTRATVELVHHLTTWYHPWFSGCVGWNTKPHQLFTADMLTPLRVGPAYRFPAGLKALQAPGVLLEWEDVWLPKGAGETRVRPPEGLTLPLPCPPNLFSLPPPPDPTCHNGLFPESMLCWTMEAWLSSLGAFIAYRVHPRPLLGFPVLCVYRRPQGSFCQVQHPASPQRCRSATARHLGLICPRSTAGGRPARFLASPFRGCC